MKYSLVENNFPTVPQGTYRAVVQNGEVIDLNRIVSEVVREGTGLTRPQAMAYCEKIFQVIEDYLIQGCRVNLPVANLKASIKGVFTGPDDVFQATRHQVNIRITPGSRLSGLGNAIKVEKESGLVRIPDLQVFTNVSGNQNDQVSSGNLAIARGANLKFAQDDPQQGLYFVKESDTTQIIKVQTFSVIKPTELHFLVPAMPAGYYYLEVRTSTQGLNARKAGSLDYLIEVQ